MRSVSYQRKVGNQFFPALLVLSSLHERGPILEHITNFYRSTPVCSGTRCAYGVIRKLGGLHGHNGARYYVY
jgi:hypothetical protein